MFPIDILLVEDNEGDILLTTEALQEGKISKNITVIKDGWEAVQFLQQKGKYINSTLPDLVLLDINLPKLNGFEILETIKNSENINNLPVIILSTSEAKEDKLRCYAEQANCYITKPADSQGFSEVIASIKNFWVAASELPVRDKL